MNIKIKTTASQERQNDRVLTNWQSRNDGWKGDHKLLDRRNVPGIWLRIAFVIRDVFDQQTESCIWWSSILSLVQFLFSFVLFFIYTYDNEYKTKENKNWTKDKIELQHICRITTLK